MLKIGNFVLTHLPEKRMSSAEFVEFLAQTDIDPKLLERFGGYVVEIEYTAPYYSAMAVNVLVAIRNHADTLLFWITGSGGGYDVTEWDTFAPDVACLLKSRCPQIPEESFFPIAPDFAAEIIAPGDWENPKRYLSERMKAYTTAQVRLLWLVYPQRQEIEIYAHGAYLKTATLEDILDGGDVLPGFTLAAKMIFE